MKDKKTEPRRERPRRDRDDAVADGISVRQWPRRLAGSAICQAAQACIRGIRFFFLLIRMTVSSWPGAGPGVVVFGYLTTSRRVCQRISRFFPRARSNSLLSRAEKRGKIRGTIRHDPIRRKKGSTMATHDGHRQRLRQEFLTNGGAAFTVPPPWPHCINQSLLR